VYDIVSFLGSTDKLSVSNIQLIKVTVQKCSILAHKYSTILALLIFKCGSGTLLLTAVSLNMIAEVLLIS
jgi:hypothetical protein